MTLIAFIVIVVALSLLGLVAYAVVGAYKDSTERARVRAAYTLLVDGQSHGPYDLETLKAFVESGRVTKESQIAVPGGPWHDAKTVPGLF